MIDLKQYVKERTIQEIPMVNMVIEVTNGNPYRSEGWRYINNFDRDSEIEDSIFNENIKDIDKFYYREYDTDVVLSFRFVNINNKKLEDFKEMVDCIGQYIYKIRKGKGNISTVKEITSWLDKNLNNLINQYR